MSGTSRLLGFAALAVMCAALPAVVRAQATSARHDSTSCPQDVLDYSEIMSSVLMPYGMMQEGMSGRMMEPGMMADGLTMGVRDGGLMMEVMQFDPDRVFGLKEQLELSPRQLDGIESLVARRWGTEASLRDGMQTAIENLQDAVTAERPDTAKVRREAERLARKRDALFAELIVNSTAARMTLTGKQREEILTGPCALHHVKSSDRTPLRDTR